MYKFLLISPLVFLTIHCAGTAANRSSTPKVQPDASDEPAIPWDELMDPLAKQRITSPRIGNASKSPAQDPRLALFLKRLKKPQAYHQGVYGKINNVVYFGAGTNKVPNWSILYRVMVSVLSEKFGCFMRKRRDIGDKIIFTCRDGRSVVFWRSRTPSWIQFYARQYDARGRELIVNNGVVVR